MSIGTIIVGLLTVAVFSHWASMRIALGTHHVRIIEQAASNGVAQLFYSTDHGYTETQSLTAPVVAGRNTLDFAIPAGTITGLRFDPVNSDETTVILNVAELRLGSATSLMQGIEALANATIHASTSALVVDPVQGSMDPQISLPVHKMAGAPLQHADLWRWLRDGALALLGVLGCGLLAHCCSTRMVVGTGMAAVAGLVLALAVLAPVKQSVNPDEFSHRDAYRYYLHHPLPPAVDDPTVVPSLSVWGYSYLMEWDVVYPIAARLTAPIAASTSDILYAARAFNVALWLGLLLIAMTARGVWPWVVAVLLLTPQAWYLFGYFNADALPMVLGLICVGLACRYDGPVGRFLQGQRPGFGVLLFCVAYGLLLVSKRNFIPLLPAIALWLAVVHLQVRAWKLVALLGGLGIMGVSVQLSSVGSGTVWGSVWLGMAGGLLVILGSVASVLSVWVKKVHRKVFVRLALLLLASVMVAAPRIGWDLVVNGSPAAKAASKNSVAEQHAGHGFRPSDVMSGTAQPSIGLAHRGTSLWDTLAGKHDWLGTSARSAFGIYGYMSVVSPAWTFIVLLLISLSVGLLAFRSVFRTSPELVWALGVVVVGCSALVCLASLLNSWVYAFQPQGRYLLPMLPLLALPLAYSPKQLPQGVVKTLLLLALLVGTYSMALVALPALAS